MYILFNEQAAIVKGTKMVKVLIVFDGLAIWALHFNHDMRQSPLLGLFNELR